jgi:archaemetzincin
MSDEPRLSAIRLVRVGALPQPLLRELALRVSERLSLPCRVAGALPDPPLLLGREQIDADATLAELEGLPREPGTVLAGATAMDMGSAIFTHHFGRARKGGHALLVSLARLSPAYYGLPEEKDVTLRRATLEMIHELGHLVGLGHCDDYRCVMRFAPTVDRIDNRGTTFCASCAQSVALFAVAPR